MFSEHVLAAAALPHAANTASRNGGSIDVRGYYNATFVLHLGVIAPGGAHTVKVQGSHDGATWSDLEGVSYAIAPGMDGAVGLLDIGHPRHRYLRLALVTDGVNSVELSAVCYRSKANREPVVYADPLSVTATRYHAPEAVA